MTKALTAMPAHSAKLVEAIGRLKDVGAMLNPSRGLPLEPPANPLEVDLGEGTFADLMGCGIVVVEQVDRVTGQTNSVVLTKANLEQLLAAVI